MTLRNAGLALLTAAAFTLAACGQKGPLFIPKQEAPVTSAPAEQAAEPAADNPSEKDEADGAGK